MSGDVPAYRDRYAVIYHAVKARDPGIKIMYNGINNSRNPSQTFGQPVDFVDEHFYLKDLSSYYRQYERIDPACQRICVAEYASSIMLGCEKNSERIWWTGYGNYAGFAGHGDFGPCLVWNDAVSSGKLIGEPNQGDSCDRHVCRRRQV
jgi:hypothetical protein